MLPWTALLLVVMAVVRGCGADEPEWACHGQAAPIDGEVLVSTLARIGFDLEREDECFGEAGEPAASFTNIPSAILDTAESDTIFASQSQVWCDLDHDDVWGGDVRRERIGDEVVFRLRNVECRIYESDPWHVEWLGRAFRLLRLSAP